MVQRSLVGEAIAQKMLELETKKRQERNEKIAHVLEVASYVGYLCKIGVVVGIGIGIYLVLDKLYVYAGAVPCVCESATHVLE